MYLLLHKFFRKIKRHFLKAKIGKETSIGFLTQIDKNSEIGKYNYIGNYCSITRSKVGNYCSIADNVIIGPGEHDYKKFSTSSIFNKDNYKSLTKKDCLIGNDVWIGANSIILRGVKVGNGAVIGAGTIVTRDVPEYSIFVGNPGKVIKYRFEKEKIEKLLESKWWEKDYKEIKENYNID